MPFLNEIASHGFIVLANGAPGQQGSTSSSWQRAAIDWVIRNAGQGAYAAVDASKIAVGGMSCGGVEAYDFIQDSRVATIGIFNSGLLGDYDRARTITKPIFYFLGGPSDIAYENVSAATFISAVAYMISGRARLQQTSIQHSPLERKPERGSWRNLPRAVRRFFRKGCFAMASFRSER